MRSELLENARSLASGFHERVQQLRELRSELDQRLEPMVQDLNNSAARIAQLNKEIAAVQASGNQPNDLLDERDQLLENLARMTGAAAHIQADGQALVSIGGHALVVGGTAIKMTVVDDADPDNAGLHKLAWEDGLDARLPASELKAIFEVRDDEIFGRQISGLNNLAAELIERVNYVHGGTDGGGVYQGGYGLNGSSGLDFFAGTDAESISISADITGVDDIAAALTAGAPGDGSNAARLADIQYETLAAAGSMTVNEAYKHQITRLGLDIRQADKNQATDQLILDALEEQRQATSGVSLDEEAANLVRYQRTYQAAARLMTAMDEMMDRVINGMGRVGL